MSMQVRRLEQVEIIRPDYVAPDDSVLAEFSSDEEEIRGLVRRALTVTGRGCLFTHDELRYLLHINEFCLPVQPEEEDSYLESLAADIADQQLERTRITADQSPLFLKRKYDGITHFGILTPYVVEGEALVEPQSLVSDKVVSIQPVEQLEPELTLELPTGPATTRTVAETLLVSFLLKPNPHGDLTIYVRDLYATIRQNLTDVDKAIVRQAISELTDNGYVDLREPTRKEPNAKLVMTRDVYADLQDEADERGLKILLDDLFDTLTDAA